jgi:hypothetical protein
MKGISDYIVTDHAAFEMVRRQIPEAVLRRVLADPEQQLEAREGRVLLQSRVKMGVPERTFLVRVLVDVDREPAEVVTAYRTSKVEKYWRAEP